MRRQEEVAITLIIWHIALVAAILTSILLLSPSASQAVVPVQTQQERYVTVTLKVSAGEVLRKPPIPGARVEGYDEAGNYFDKTTNKRGFIKIRGKPGTWHFTVSKDRSVGEDLTITWDEEITETCKRERSLTIPSCNISPNPNERITMTETARYALKACFKGEDYKDAATIVAIAWAESFPPGNPYACEYVPPWNKYCPDSWSRGILQINDVCQPWVTDDEAFNPADAFKAAYIISKGGTNFNAWCTYFEGKDCKTGPGQGPYKNHLDEARDAIRRALPSITHPTQHDPTNVGPYDNPSAFEIAVELAQLKTPDIAEFEVLIGGKRATIMPIREYTAHCSPPSWYDYILHVIPPKQDAPGLYDLEVKYQDLLAKEPQAVRYTTAITPTGNVSAVLVIDRTGSMKGEKILQARNAAVLFTFLQMRVGDEIGVVSFSTDLSGGARAEYDLKEIESRDDKESVREEIDKISASGATPIGAGLSKGQDQLDMANPGNPHAMILLSDGLENRHLCVDEVLPKIPEKTDIYTVAFGPDETESGECGTVRGHRVLQRIATRTGGEFQVYDPNKLADLLNIYLQIGGKLTGQQTLLSRQGTITKGATEEIKNLIDSTIQKIIFMLGWPGSDLNLTLVRPDGSIIDQAVAAADPNITFRSGPTFKSYEITSPMPGEWQLRVEGVNVPPGGEEYTAMAMGIAGLTLDAYFDKDYYVPNEPITILASLLEDGTPVTNATVKVETSKPDGSMSTLTLFDNGLHDDGFADDGVYGNTYTETAKDGSYTFILEATGETSRGEPFTRTLRRSLFLGAPIGTISGEIFYEGKQRGKVYIQAWADDPTMAGDPDYQATIDQPRAYTVDNLPDGTYYLAAFLDSNGNGKPDRLEPKGIFGVSTPEPVMITNGEAVTKIYIILYEIPLVVVARYAENCPQGTENPDKIICQKEIEWASWLYLNGQEVPGTGGKRIDLKSLREMVSYYITQTPIDQPAPRVSSQEVTAQLEPLVGIEKAKQLKVEGVKNVPNPVTGTNTANFIVEGQGIKQIEVQIFDLSGRRVFDSGEVLGSTFEWHLLNNNGQTVANGVYLYLVTVEGFNGELLKSPVKKMVVLR